MLAGRFKLVPPGKTGGRGLCLALHLDNDVALSYLDDQRMGKVYLLRSGDRHLIPKFASQGVDIISEAFTERVFLQLLAGQRKQVRVFLMDQSRLSAIGNAYADEILFDAGIHPKTFCHQLSEDERHRLFKSIGQVIQWGITEVARAGKPIDIKVRDHVKVRNRKNQPCPRCRTPIRRAGVLGQDTFFCPQCQPAKRSQFIDWGQTR
jgi:formamidopyrimidine-DNA glycosylase